MLLFSLFFFVLFFVLFKYCSNRFGKVRTHDVPLEYN